MQGQTKMYGLVQPGQKARPALRLLQSRLSDAADENWTPPQRQPRPRMVGEEPWADIGTPRQRRERYLRMLRGEEPRVPRNVSEWYVYHGEVEQLITEEAA
jgi:hypothetical protein